jgi:hypothetical protein
MKPAISITTILGCVLATGLASAQSPSIIQNARDTMNGVSARETAASNEALGLNQPAPKASATTRVAASSTSAVSTPAKTQTKTSVAVGMKPSSPKKSGHAKHAAVLVQQAAKPAPAAAQKESAAATAPAASSGAGDSQSQGAANEQSVTPDTKYAANGRRDPFISPVISHAGGSGCNTGKKCLEIGAINLRGVVHAESGFIAVVSNGLNKAYFLRENDPVFNGYVMKITGDSIVFQETLQDRLGKSFTREVVKKITTPAV